MYKGFIPEIAKEVGKSAALLLNQLFQWYKSNNGKKIYRTNEQLVGDLEGLLSESTIQRCKKKLVGEGFIEISFDQGNYRPTHFSLTEKALSFFAATSVKPVKKEEKREEKQAPTRKFASEGKKGWKPVTEQVIPAAMKASFEEQGKKRDNVVAAPADLAALIRGKAQAVKAQEEKEAEKKAEIIITTNDEEFFGAPVLDKPAVITTPADEAFFKSLNVEELLGVSRETSVASVVGLGFNSVPNVDVLEYNRQLLEQSVYFKEDY